MAPRKTPKLPPPEEFMKLTSGPRVDIYVGANKKHFNLPKDLLTYYSPYFDRCFNGSFLEGKTQKLELSEDREDDFAILIQYMLHGTVPDLMVPVLVGPAVKRCMDFIEYADKYNLEGASLAVCKPLKSALAAGGDYYFRDPRPSLINGSDIELVFRTTSVGHPLRTLVVQGALSVVQGPQNAHRFRKQEEEVEGYAAELLLQIRKGNGNKNGVWVDPLTTLRFDFKNGLY